MIKKKKMNLLVSLLITAAVVLFLAGCGNNGSTPSTSGTSSKSTTGSSVESPAESTKDGGVLVFGITTEPDHLDPYQAATADTREILFNVFEGLVKPDKDGNLQPAVAEKLPDVSSDALTYTFTIRNEIKFQNGNAVTADDVKYSLDTAAGLKIAGLENIQSVNVVDPSTVKITLKTPDNDFLPYLTVAIVPKDYKDQNAHPIGTGPFAFESFTPQQSLILKKNTNYWQKGLPYLDQVTFKLESNTNALLLDLQSGSVDGASIDNSAAKQLNNNFNIIQSNSNAVQQLNLNNAVKPFSDVKVRQALSYVIDPDEIITTVTFGKGTRVGTPVIPGLKAYFESNLTNAYSKDIEKAKQLLSEAGYPNGFSFTITVPSNYQVHVDTAQVIVNELAVIGIKADIKQVDWATWISQVYTGRKYDATIISVDGANLSPKSFLGRYVSTASNNFFNYSNPEFDTLYDKATKEPDLNKRIELFKQSQQLVSKDAANVYIQDIASLTALKKGFDGFTPYPLYVLDASTIFHTK